MNKTFNRLAEVRNDSSDTASKIYRIANDISRQLDDQRARAQSARELFREIFEIQRVKLRDCCEKLMFIDPVNYGKKAEEFLWKKTFYEVVTTAKHLNRKKGLDDCEKALVHFHLQSGIGHYHHLIMKLQAHFKLDLRGAVDFPLIVADKGLKKDKPTWSSKAIEIGRLEWAQEAVVRCLIYLGDLCRYLHEFDPTFDPLLAQRYYSQAFSLKPECGTPHNQMGTMALSQNYGLDSAYHYMRSISCKQRFDGAEANYQNLFDSNLETMKDLKRNSNKTSYLPVQNSIIYFVHMTYCLFYEKQISQNEMYSKLMRELQACFNEMKNPDLRNEKGGKEPTVLNELMVFKMIVMLVMCVQKLKAKGSSSSTFAMSVCVSISCLVLEYAVHRLNEVLSPRQEPQTNGFKQVRRRRRRRLTNGSDISDDESLSAYSSGSDPGEEILVFDQCNKLDEEIVADFELEGRQKRNGETIGEDSVSSVSLQQHLQPWSLSQVLSNKSFVQLHRISSTGYLLQTLKIIFDWFTDIKFTMKCNGVISSTDSLVSNFVTFMNHLTAVPNLKALQEYLDEGVITMEEINQTPLPEDAIVKGLAGLKISQAQLDWNKFKVKVLVQKQETYIRIQKLVAFGINLAGLDESPINYLEAKLWFTASTKAASPTVHKNGFHKEGVAKDTEGLMKSLAEMWLKSEVTQLEWKTKRGELPAYLVLDTAAFLYHSSLVKQLAASKQFVLVVPSVVVSALDYEKHKGGGGRVRDTMRWIEYQVKQGSRFVRTQRPNEHTPIPFIKYPKKKDKDACVFIQVVECAYYLSNQSTGEKNSGLVTLLTGSVSMISKQNGFSPIGVAKSAGINVEFIETFLGKWKASSKSHG